QNVKRASTDQEARQAYSQQATPFRKQPPEQLGLSSGVNTTGTGGLVSEAQIPHQLRQGTAPAGTQQPDNLLATGCSEDRGRQSRITYTFGSAHWRSEGGC